MLVTIIAFIADPLHKSILVVLVLEESARDQLCLLGLGKGFIGDLEILHDLAIVAGAGDIPFLPCNFVTS